MIHLVKDWTPLEHKYVYIKKVEELRFLNNNILLSEIISYDESHYFHLKFKWIFNIHLFNDKLNISEYENYESTYDICKLKIQNYLNLFNVKIVSNRTLILL